MDFKVNHRLDYCYKVIHVVCKVVEVRKETAHVQHSAGLNKPLDVFCVISTILNTICIN